jgi:hypothetical protein
MYTSVCACVGTCSSLVMSLVCREKLGCPDTVKKYEKMMNHGDAAWGSARGGKTGSVKRR